MRLEDIEDVSDLDNDELYRLRLVAMQQYQKADHHAISRDEILGKYKILKGEIERRQMLISPHEMDRILAKQEVAEMPNGSLNVSISGLAEADFPNVERISREIENSVANLLKTKLLIGGNLKANNIRAEMVIGDSVYSIGAFMDMDGNFQNISFTDWRNVTKSGSIEKTTIIKIDKFSVFQVEDNLYDISGGGIVPDGLYEIGETTISKKESISKPGLDETSTSFRYRLRDPGDFTRGSFSTITIKKDPPRIMCVIGRLKGEQTTTKQNYIFPKEDGWAREKVQAWLAGHVEKSGVVYFRIMKKNEPEYIVGGIVYEANVTDSQGDSATGSEIWGALKTFMLNKSTVKIQHQGRQKNIPIVECYQYDEDTRKGGTEVKKDSWWLSVCLKDEKEVWDDVKNGELTGFSMAGMATKA